MSTGLIVVLSILGAAAITGVIVAAVNSGGSASYADARQGAPQFPTPAAPPQAQNRAALPQAGARPTYRMPVCLDPPADRAIPAYRLPTAAARAEQSVLDAGNEALSYPRCNLCWEINRISRPQVIFKSDRGYYCKTGGHHFDGIVVECTAR